MGLTLIALVVAGYLGWRAIIQAHGSRPTPQRTASAAGGRAAPDQNAVGQPAGATSEPLVTNRKPEGEPEPAVPSGARVLPFIDRSRGVSVGPDEGLLVVEYDVKDTPAPRVRVGGRELGPAPIATALPGGRHELMLKRGAQTSFRYVVIHPGETRIVELGVR